MKFDLYYTFLPLLLFTLKQIDNLPKSRMTVWPTALDNTKSVSGMNSSSYTVN